MDAKWEELREKERDLRSAFIKYNKFIKVSVFSIGVTERTRELRGNMCHQKTRT